MSQVTNLYKHLQEILKNKSGVVFLLPDLIQRAGHNSAIITHDGIGPTKMTSGWIYKLRKLRGL